MTFSIQKSKIEIGKNTTEGVSTKIDQGRTMLHQILNLNYLLIKTDKETKSIHINQAETNDFLSLNILRELQALFEWIEDHIEINSIWLTLPRIELKKNDLHNAKLVDLEEYTVLVCELIEKMYALPQTIIVDMGENCDNFAFDLAMAADTRVAHQNINCSLNHQSLGLIPFLTPQLVVSFPILKNWHQAPIKKLSVHNLHQQGILYSDYSSDNEKEHIKKDITFGINALPPVSRIQGKHSHYLSIKKRLKELIDLQRKTVNATLYSHDWGRDKSEQLKARSMREILKQTQEIVLSKKEKIALS